MNLLLCLVILLVIIIISRYYVINRSYFTVKTDTKTGTNKDIGEVYTYGNCVGCLTNDHRLKPGFKYNISDDRCVKNNSYNYVNESELQRVLNYEGVPNQDLASCNSDYNSLYSTITGRYIMLFRTDTVKMRFNHISVNGRIPGQNPLSASAVIFASNIEKDTSGNYVYPETVLNSIDSSNTTFENGTFATYGGSFIIISLPTENPISYVRIAHANSTDASTLVGSYLVVMKDSDFDPDADDKEVVFYTSITGNDTNRLIYTYNHLTQPFPNGLYPYMQSTNWWYFDNKTVTCDNCGSMSGNLFKNHAYVNIDQHRCYKPLLDNIPRSIIDSEIPENDLTTKFKTCIPDFDTRFLPAYGKIIYITKNSGTTGIIISKLEIYNETHISSYTPSDLANLTVLAQNYLNDSSTFENVLDTDENTKLITTNDTNSKILINLGTVGNKVITGLKIKTPEINRFDLVGIKIYVISVDITDPNNVSKMKVTCIRDITSNDVDIIKKSYGDTSSVTYMIGLNALYNEPLSSYPDVVINNEVLYDIANKYKTTYKVGTSYYQVPYTIYRTSIGRKVFSLTSANVVDTIDKIEISDAVTLFNMYSGNNNISNVPGLINSYLLTPIVARYLHIIAASGKSLTGLVNTITIYDSNHTIHKQVSNPPIIYTIPNNDYQSMVSTTSTGAIGSSYILIDIARDVSITFIQINLNSTTNFTNASVSLVNSFNVEVYTKVISSPQTSNYLLTDYNVINTPNILFPNKFDYTSCITNDTCTSIAPNSYYITNDNRCFKSVDKPTICATGCMDQLLTFNASNKSTTFGNNFISCSLTAETRFKIGNDFISWDTSVDANILTITGAMALSNGAIYKLIPTITPNYTSLDPTTLAAKLAPLSASNITKTVDAQGRPGLTKDINSVLYIINNTVSWINRTLFFVYNRLTPGNTNEYLFGKRESSLVGKGANWLIKNGANIIDGQYYNVLNSTGMAYYQTGVGVDIYNNINIIAIQWYNDSSNTFTKKYRTFSENQTTSIVPSYSGTLVNDNSFWFSLGGLTKTLTDGSAAFDRGCKMILHEVKITTQILSDIQIDEEFNNLYNKWIRQYITLPPTGISNTDQSLLLWFDASDISTLYQDTSGTIPVTSGGQYVRMWKNKAVSANNLVAASATTTNIVYNTTTYRINNNPTVTGVNAGILMNFNNPTMLSGAIDCTFIMVYRHISTVNSPGFTRRVYDDIAWMGYGTTPSENLGLDQRYIFNFNNGDLSRQYIYTIIADHATNTNIYKDKNFTTPFFTAPYGSSAFSSGQMIGYGSFGTKMALCEIILYNKKLTESTTPKLSEVINYLGLKWGII